MIIGDEKKKNKFLIYYGILFSPALLLIVIFSLFSRIKLPDIFIYFILYLFVFLLVVGIIFPIYLFFHYKTKNQKPKFWILIVFFAINFILAILIILPSLMCRPRKAYFSISKGDLKNIAVALDMYYDDNNCFPNDKHPISENGTLIKEEYFPSALTDPKTKNDYIVEYTTNPDSYVIYCPNPEKYYYSPKKNLKVIKYIYKKGIVTEPEGK